MSDRLSRVWERSIGQALSWRPGDDPEPVLEALGLLFVLEVTGRLGQIAGSDRKQLLETGRRALLAGLPNGVDPDDAALARAVGRAGVELLSGRPARPPKVGTHPGAVALSR